MKRLRSFLTICALALLTSPSDADRRPSTRTRVAKTAAKTSPKTAQKPAPKPTIVTTPKQDLTVTLLGEFASQGVFPFREGMTVKDAVEAAGGFTSSADARSVTLRRTGSDSLASLDGEKALVDDLIQNAALRPGDVLFVAAKSPESKETAAPPPAEKADPAHIETAAPEPAPEPESEPAKVQVDGAVEKPGIYLYAPMMLSRVFESVGGLKKDADLGRIVIFRGTPDDPASARQVKYDLKKVRDGKSEDLRLEPGDIIQVPVRKKSFWDRVGSTFKKIGTRSLLGGVPFVGPLLGG